jgi:hypothetical protein
MRELPSRCGQTYNKDMARGWESKSIEAQIEDKNLTSPNQNPEKPISHEEAHRMSRRANLQLSRQRILHQLESSTNERYSEMLRHSLAELEGQLSSGS